MANSLFAILAASDEVKLGARIVEKLPGTHLSVGAGEWLVVAPSTTTTKELSEILGVASGETGTAILIRVDSYWGRATSDVWEWIRARMGAVSDAATV